MAVEEAVRMPAGGNLKLDELASLPGWAEVMASVILAPTTELSEEEIHSEIKAIQVLLGRLQARRLALLAEVDKRALHKKEGCLSVSQFAAKHFKLAPRNARSLSKMADSLTELPLFSEALSKGALSIDQLEPLASVARKEDQADILTKAQGLSAIQCRNLAQSIELQRSLCSKDKADPQAVSKEKRYLSLSQVSDGTWSISGLMAPTDGAILYKALSDLAKKAPVNPETGKYDSWGKRMCDALVDLVTDTPGQGHGLSEIVIHVAQEVLEGKREGLAAMEAGQSGIIPVGKDTLERFSCDCLVRVLIENAQGRPLSVSQARRTPPFFLRSLLTLRDGTCRFPGCSNDVFLHAHHIEHWSKGGPTTKDNLVLVCSRHHTILHEGHWKIQGNPSGEISFVSPEGLAFTSSPMPP